MNRRAFPVASLLALLLIGLAFWYLIRSETPRGQVQGVTVLADAANKPLSGCDVYLTPATPDEDADDEPRAALASAQDPRERRHAVTDRSGHFSLRGVPAGAYTLSASARWHAMSNVKVMVDEGRVVAKTLRLARSEPDLGVGDHQATFATAEQPFLPVRGYVALTPNRGTPPTRTLHVKIWRTRLSEVLKRTDAAADLQKLRYSYDGNQATLSPALLRPADGAAERPELVADTDVPIQNADREGFFANRTPLAAARNRPGLYLVKFSYGKFAACSYVLVTDLALVVKQAPGQVVGYAAHLQRGTPVAGARLRVLRKGRTLVAGRTGADGIATLVSEGINAHGDAEDDTPLLTMASYGQDEAVVSRNYWSGDENAGDYVVHTVTDRTVYRPGDTISYKGIVRRHRDDPDTAPGYRVPCGLSVTVEVRDASGGLLRRDTKTTNDSGSFWGSVDTSAEGETGAYTIVTRVGGEEHTAEVLIAAYRKPEYAVTVTPVKARYRRGETVELAIGATYYFGAPVAGATVHYYVYRDADWSAEYGPQDDDSGYGEEGESSGYHDSAYQAYYGETVAEGDTTLDENGKAIVRVRTDVRHPQGESDDAERDKAAKDEPLPQAETYTLTASVEDEAKRAVESEGAARVTAGDLVLNVAPEGYVATPGKPTQVFVTARDPEGKLAPGVAVTLAASYDVWDVKKKQSTNRPLGTPQTATTGADGRAVLGITPSHTGELRLVATAKDSGGRAIRSEGSLWAAGDNSDDLDTDYGDLTLLTDRRQYAPGDTARVLVNASRTGQTVLLTVEGDRVYRSFTVPIRKRSTVVQVPIRAAWGPNVVLVANYVRDKKFASSETPLRVALAARNLAVSVRPVGGDRYQPGDTVTYAVTTKDAATGRPVAAECALSVVDESIYALREDDPKALRKTFYPPRTNRVQTAYSFSVEYLGDVSKAEPKIQARTKFKDTAYWQPELRTGDDGQATVRVSLPDNLTTWRATVNAVSDDTAVGYGIGKVVSSKPFSVRLETPRYLTGGDTSRLMALVHNETGQEQQVQVRLVASTLRLGADETQSFTVPAGGVGKAEWPVTVPNLSGDAPLRVTAWTPKISGKTQYTDGIERSLPVRAYGRADFTTFAGVLEPGSGTAAPEAGETPLAGSPGNLTFNLDPAAVPQETRLTLRVTPSLRGALVGGVEYLVGFPYGCTEQTMSRFYPDLLVEDYHLLTAKQTRADLPRMVRDGLARLKRFQHAESGGWGWWETDPDDAFMTAYVLVGLAQARENGYPVDDALLDRGRKAAEKLAATAPARDRPFLLYALQAAGYTDDTTGILHAPFRYSSVRTKLVAAKLPVDALAYLVLLGQRLGIDPGSFATELDRRATVEGRLLHWSAWPGKKYDYHCSDRMATALALRALLARNPDDPRINAVLRWLMQGRTDGYFGDTRDTAWVLVALCDYLRVHPEAAAEPGGMVAVRINGATVKRIDLAIDAQGEPELALSLPTDGLRTGPNTLQLVPENGVASTVFYAGALRQTIAAPTGTELPAVTRNGITIQREVLRVVPRKVGESSWRLTTEPVRDGRFAQGDRLRIRLTITADREGSYVLIEDPFPSGAEVTERGTAEQEIADSSDWTFWYDHVDVRDDRIAFFTRKLPKGKQVIEYNLRAQTPGTSRALPTVLEGMYDAGLHGESGTTPIEVKP